MKTYWTLLFVILLTAAVPARASYYLVGNAPFGGWKTNAGLELTQSGSVYTAEAELSGTVYFVVATQLCATADDWSTFASYRMGPKTNNTVVTEGTAVTAYSGQGGNSFMFTGTGSFTFSFNPSTNALTITLRSGTSVDPVTGELYILGEAEGNAWDPSVGVQLETTDGNVFTGTVTFNGEHSEEGDGRELLLVHHEAFRVEQRLGRHRGLPPDARVRWG